MLADDFIVRVLHGLQKVVVGADDMTFGGELDHRHGTADRRQHGFFFMLLVDARGDVRRHLDDTSDLFVRTEHRHVTGFKPDFAAALVQAQESAAERFTTGQIAPQLRVVLAAIKALFAEDPMVLAANLIGGVAQGLAEVLVGVEDDPFRGELDHRHRAADRFYLRVGFGQRTAEALDFPQVSLVM